MEEFKTFPATFLGNDPSIGNLEKYAAREGQVALIATSGMRAILLACELNAQNITECIPKIYLLDYSERVYHLWKSIKVIAHFNKTPEDFLCALNKYLDENPSLKSSVDNEKEIHFFKKLFNCFNFDYVRKIILGTAYLRQSWEDHSTFYKLKNIFKALEIKNKYVYASNIVACSPTSAQTI